MILSISTETIEQFVARLARPVLTIEVASRFGLSQHEANLKLDALRRAGKLSRSTIGTVDHGYSYTWCIAELTVTE